MTVIIRRAGRIIVIQAAETIMKMQDPVRPIISPVTVITVNTELAAIMTTGDIPDAAIEGITIRDTAIRVPGDITDAASVIMDTAVDTGRHIGDITDKLPPVVRVAGSSGTFLNSFPRQSCRYSSCGPEMSGQRMVVYGNRENIYFHSRFFDWPFCRFQAFGQPDCCLALFFNVASFTDIFVRTPYHRRYWPLRSFILMESETR